MATMMKEKPKTKKKHRHKDADGSGIVKLESTSEISGPISTEKPFNVDPVADEIADLSIQNNQNAHSNLTVPNCSKDLSNTIIKAEAQPNISSDNNVVSHDITEVKTVSKSIDTGILKENVHTSDYNVSVQESYKNINRDKIIENVTTPKEDNKPKHGDKVRQCSAESTVNSVHKIRFNEQTKVYSDEIVKPKLVPYLFEEVIQLFGAHEVVLAREYNAQFRLNEDSNVILDHPLYENLVTFQRAHRSLKVKSELIKSLLEKSSEKQQTIWKKAKREEKKSSKCQDNNSLSVSVTYEVATLNSRDLNSFKMQLQSVREEISDTYSIASHNLLFMKHQINEMLCAVANDPDETKDYLKILFYALRTMCSVADEDFDVALIDWCYYMSHSLLNKSFTLQNMLFVLNNLLRQPRSTRWANSLLRLNVTNLSGVVISFCILEAILTSRCGAKENGGGEYHRIVLMKSVTSSRMT